MFSYDVKVTKLQSPAGKTLGFADITVDGLMTIKGFKIIDGANGRFVAAPSHKGKDKEGNEKYFPDIWFQEEPVGKEKMGPKQAEIYQAILDEFGRDEGKNPRQQAAKQQANTSKGKTGEYW